MTAQPQSTSGQDGKAAAAARILYVDDEPLLHRAFKRSLSGLAVELVGTCDPREGLELLSKQEFAVVVSDYSMPGMSGLAFLDEVSARRPDATRILVTGQADLEAEVLAVRQNARHQIVTKPWTREGLCELILRGCEEYQKRHGSKEG
ncbi:MAG: response regulator [Deltaproteobacteria bacterium]|nr:response regulator [Deltaproteobacteria bacterium]